jgi:zinc protease
MDRDEHERLRRETLGLLDEIRDDDSSLCARFFERFALAGHRYGRSVIGTEGSLAGITHERAAEWASAHVSKSALIAGFAGDTREVTAFELVDRTLAPLRDGLPPARADHGTPALPSGRRTYLIDKPERAQSQILIGHAGPPHADPDWLPLHVGATVFGGMFTSRLTTEVRVKRGWSYGAGCRVGRARLGHTFRIRVFPSAEQTPDTVALVLSLWEEIAAHGITDEELGFARSYLEGSWAFEIDTPAKRLDHKIDELTYDLPAGTYARFLDRLRSVSRDDVNAAIRKWWHPSRAVTVITCTAEALRPRLAKVALGDIDVVGYDSY